MSDDYFKRWYEERAPELSKRRRARYRDDPDYRDRVREGARKRARKRRMRALEETRRARSRAKVSGQQPSGQLTSALTEGGEEVDGVFVNATGLARLLGVSRKTVYNRLASGDLPEGSHRTPHGGQAWSELEVRRIMMRPSQPASSPPPPSCREYVVENTSTAERVTLQLYRPGVFASVMGVSTSSLRRWESDGKIPPTPLDVRKGDQRHRLYTADQIRAAHRVTRSIPFDEWHDAIRDAWEALGVPILRVID